jgi:hypothetical protein
MTGFQSFMVSRLRPNLSHAYDGAAKQIIALLSTPSPKRGIDFEEFGVAKAKP